MTQPDFSDLKTALAKRVEIESERNQKAENSSEPKPSETPQPSPDPSPSSSGDFLPPTKSNIPPGANKLPPKGEDTSRNPEEDLLNVRENPSNRKALNRVTVVDRVYHHYNQNNPVMFETKYSSSIETDEAAYSRPSFKVEEEWTAIDLGWVGVNAGIIGVQNLSGKNLETNPTPEERSLIAAKILDVGILLSGNKVEPFSFVRPGEGGRFNLLPGKTYCVRSRSGRIEVSLFVIPR